MPATLLPWASPTAVVANARPASENTKKPIEHHRRCEKRFLTPQRQRGCQDGPQKRGQEPLPTYVIITCTAASLSLPENTELPELSDSVSAHPTFDSLAA